MFSGFDPRIPSAFETELSRVVHLVFGRSGLGGVMEVTCLAEDLLGGDLDRSWGFVLGRLWLWFWWLFLGGIHG